MNDGTNEQLELDVTIYNPNDDEEYDDHCIAAYSS